VLLALHERGTSPTVREGSQKKARTEPSLTVGLMPRTRATHNSETTAAPTRASLQNDSAVPRINAWRNAKVNWMTPRKQKKCR